MESEGEGGEGEDGERDELNEGQTCRVVCLLARTRTCEGEGGLGEPADEGHVDQRRCQKGENRYSTYHVGP